MDQKLLTKPLPLQCGVQKYHWGLPGSLGYVGSLSAYAANEDPCAELWIGAHPNLPARVVLEEGQQDLNVLIDQHTQVLLGEEVSHRFATQLPFLLKVLSIAKPLSIQVHPNRDQALKLREQGKDSRAKHKPEVGLALTVVQLLIGFRSRVDLAMQAQRLPVLQRVWSEELIQALADKAISDRELLQRMSARLFGFSEAEIHEYSRALKIELQVQQTKFEEDVWVLKLLDGEYPRGDVGLFCFYLFNLRRIDPGEGVFIGPGVPHAYLSGELVECMANSDTVLRAGLTPKERDVDSLLEILDYHCTPQYDLQVGDHPEFKCVKRYDLPSECAAVEEFSVNAFFACDELRTVRTAGKPELLFCLDGAGRLLFDSGSGPESLVLKAGSAFFVPASCTQYTVELPLGRLYRVLVP